ncbi:FAS1 domain-containing protein [Thozetella sp. PMI_491]|nr:FAS1 domain-containing protein [Thozetella sp. PMI_491]
MASATIFETVTETETRIESATETVTQTETKIESTTVTVTELSPSSSLQPSKLPSLAEALIAAGCSNFLHYIQSNATVWEIFNSPQTQTVFAPSDRFFSFNGSLIASRFRARGDGDESTTEAGQATYQSGTDRANMARIRNPPGQVQNTNNRNANLKGNSQKVVSDSRDPSVAAHPSKRDIVARSDLLLRQAENTSISLDSLVRIDSGLGAVNNIINGDIAYTGGLIQVTDGLFTLPKNTTRTSIATGETTFADLADRAGLLDLVDKTPSITVFIPSNDAFDIANLSPSTNITELAKALGGHIVKSTSDHDIGYLPNLKNGDTLTTTTGSTLQITVSGDDYFINDAMITRANLVLENGVAHVIDKVLTGAKALPDLCSAANATTSSPAASETPNSGTARSPSKMSTLFFHFISITAIIMFLNENLV